MILAAGLGTRLGNHTLERPKALVEVDGKPLLAYVLEKIVSSGFKEVVINVHHFAEQIVSYIESHDFGVRIHISDESDRLLNTGGGILNARPFLDGDKPFLVHNVDILSDININHLIEFHIKQNALVTLAVGQRRSNRYFLFDEQMILSGWRNNITEKEVIPKNSGTPLKGYAFAGIHVISPEIFQLIHTKGAFSIVDAYLSLCSSQTIIAMDTSNNFVVDVGKPQNLEKAKEFVQKINR